jgi:membrane-associated phospholipid phosphatase
MRVSYSMPASPGSVDRTTPPEPPPTRTTHDRHDTRTIARLAATFVLAYALLTAACVGLGLFLTDAGAAVGIRRWDESVNRWFVHQRTGTLDALTAVGSHLAETSTVVGLGLIVVALVWWRRRDLYAVGILVMGLLLEVSAFVSTTLFVDRSRPPVHHLDAAPPTSSFPSGHTAAAIVLYVGLVIVVHRVWRRRAVTLALTTLLVLVPVGVGLSRLYRGMHHPTDVFASLALGTAALLVACIAVRAAIIRSGRPDPTAPDPTRVPSARVATLEVSR